MPVKSKTISGGTIKAENATYQTYIEHLCRCDECGDEIYLAKGTIIKPHWRHFPGKGEHCPDKSVKRIKVYSFDSITHDQCREAFKRRFLEILDIAWHENGNLKNRQAASSLIYSIPVPGSKRIESRTDCVFFNDIYLAVDKLRKNLTACTIILNGCLEKSFSGMVRRTSTQNIDLADWDYKNALYTKNYEKHKNICNEALKYLFGNGRQDLLKEVLAKIIVMYFFSGTFQFADAPVLNAFRKNDPEWEMLSPKTFPYYCVVSIISNLIHVPWERIISDLNQNVIPQLRKDQTLWLFPSSSLQRTVELFYPKKEKRHFPKGF